MSLTIDIEPELQERLSREARRLGMQEADFAKRLIAQHLADLHDEQPTRPDTATLALFAKWDEEDATSDPAELQRRREDWEQLKQALNRNRETVGARKLFP